jgi:hypothetical protein
LLIFFTRAGTLFSGLKLSTYKTHLLCWWYSLVLEKERKLLLGSGTPENNSLTSHISGDEVILFGKAFI